MEHVGQTRERAFAHGRLVKREHTPLAKQTPLLPALFRSFNQAKIMGHPREFDPNESISR